MNIREQLGIDTRDPGAELARRLVEADRDLLEDLIRVRESSGLSQTDIADLMGVSPSAVSRIESGARDPHLSTLRRYAYAVGAQVSHHVSRFDAERWHARLDALPASASTWDIWLDVPEVTQLRPKSRANA